MIPRRGPLNITVRFHEICETVTSAGAVSSVHHDNEVT